MTSEQQHFFHWLDDNLAYLNHLFDRDTPEYKSDVVDTFLSVASSGEQIMARFVLSIWLHNNSFGFDLFEALKTLDDKNLTIIRHWMNDPFWP